MCKCTREIKTPFCGKGNCLWPTKEDKHNKYKPFYHFSEDAEEVEIRITAKKILNKYVIQYPSTWVCDREDKLIWVNELFINETTPPGN